MMKYLGLDLGSKTLGIAISDASNTIASVLKTIRFSDEDYQSLIEPLKEILINNDVKTVVLGYPLNMNGTVGVRAEICLKFKEMLEGNLN